MKENSSLFSCTLILVVISLACAEYDELCNRFADGIKFREPGNCLAYVTCENGTGTVTDCPNDEFYDKDNSKCVATLDDDYCNNPCNDKNDVFVSDKKNCFGYYYCRSSEAIAGTCSEGYHFDEAKQMCVYPSESECYDVSNICGILPANIQFSYPDNCNKFYQCTKGAAKSDTCKKGNYFDVSTATCIDMNKVSCSAHPIPSNICGKDSKPKSNKFVPDQITCRGYYFCAYKGAKLADKNPAWNQCKEGYFFQEKTESCVETTAVSCTYNRCDGRGNLLVIAEDWGCRNYIVCENGVTVEELKCPRDMFFHEGRQACIYEETSYPICDY